MHYVTILNGNPYFYIDGMENIPDSAIEITEQNYLNAVAHTNAGGTLSIDQGSLILDEIVKSLDQLKEEKATQFNLLTRAEIYKGYQSDALGTMHHYPALDRDQANMIASVTDSYNPQNANDWTTPFWCRDPDGAWALRSHTAAQIQKAGKDAKAAITTAIAHNVSKQLEIINAANESALNDITYA